jgi:hypothetical protein
MKIIKQTTWNVVEHVTIRTLLERLKASNENKHCMHGLLYAESIESDLYTFHNNWNWIKEQPLEKKLYVVDSVESYSYLT